MEAGVLQHTLCLPITKELYRNVESLDGYLDPCDEPQLNWNLYRNEKLTSSSRWSAYRYRSCLSAQPTSMCASSGHGHRLTGTRCA